jgi:hypothetical protein
MSEEIAKSAAFYPPSAANTYYIGKPNLSIANIEKHKRSESGRENLNLLA